MLSKDKLSNFQVKFELNFELKQVVLTFNTLFAKSYQTRLVGGAKEPYYRPSIGNGSDETSMHTIYFREDFVSSALHEIAHWCLAGSARRKLEDYGYWYQAERDEAAQRRFENVEVYPQAIEWVLSVAAGVKFRVSTDNLMMKDYDSIDFKRAVHARVHVMLSKGLPRRIYLLADKLAGSKVNYRQLDHYQDLPA